MFVTIQIFWAVVELCEGLSEGRNVVFDGVLVAFLSLLLWKKKVNQLNNQLNNFHPTDRKSVV